MIGNETASKAFEQEFSGKIYRFVDLEDVVPHLPSVSLIANAYAHCQNEVGLSAVQVVAEWAGGTQSGWHARATERWTPAMADQVWEVVKGRIASHLIGTYQSRVEAKCKDAGLAFSALLLLRFIVPCFICLYDSN